ncbi:MAG TPA: HPF/RaiA family ribosome-associated protein [Flavisolibacter sp.]|nr:HPF/RaiA family ribosome-associated protein [Flavisolibacter sp.]HWJ91794.1 HPF/RaiA family ribosome-associated protein [Flavisolibacter sp.]
MEIIIKSVNFKIDGPLETLVREKVSKLFQHSQTIIRAYVVLRNGEYNNPQNKMCEIRLVVPGNDHVVKKSTEVLEKSIAMAVEMLQKILRRHKNKQIANR